MALVFPQVSLGRSLSLCNLGLSQFGRDFVSIQSDIGDLLSLALDNIVQSSDILLESGLFEVGGFLQILDHSGVVQILSFVERSVSFFGGFVDGLPGVDFGVELGGVGLDLRFLEFGLGKFGGNVGNLVLFMVEDVGETVDSVFQLESFLGVVLVQDFDGYVFVLSGGFQRESLLFFDRVASLFPGGGFQLGRSFSLFGQIELGGCLVVVLSQVIGFVVLVV